MTCCLSHPVTAHWPVADLRSFLAGDWRLERRITDHRAGVDGRFDGRASFIPDGNDLEYREEGTLTLGAFSGPAFRTYRYTFPAPSRALVLFADGRPFHAVDLTAGAAPVGHLCGADTYTGHYAVAGPGAWTLTWRVGGPRKDLELAGTYRRADPA